MQENKHPFSESHVVQENKPKNPFVNNDVESSKYILSDLF